MDLKDDSYISNTKHAVMITASECVSQKHPNMDFLPIAFINLLTSKVSVFRATKIDAVTVHHQLIYNFRK